MKTQAYGCGLEAALAVVGGKWKPIVLWHLAPGPRRFGELRRLVTGISEKMLIQQLRRDGGGRDRGPQGLPGGPAARRVFADPVRRLARRGAEAALRLGPRTHGADREGEGELRASCN